eukprot:5987422-Pyramimonas_sp.AAC.1
MSGSGRVWWRKGRLKGRNNACGRSKREGTVCVVVRKGNEQCVWLFEKGRNSACGPRHDTILH